MDRAFRDQINRVSPLDVPGLTRVWHVDLATPGDGPDDQRAARARVEALKAALPDILRQFEHAGLTKRRVRRSPTRDDSAAQDSLRGLGVQLCSSFDPHPDQSPQVFFRDASLGGATGPSMIVDAVNENLPNKVRKLVNAKTARAAEAAHHLIDFKTLHKMLQSGSGSDDICSESRSCLRTCVSLS